jgi:hypothetical protein
LKIEKKTNITFLQTTEAKKGLLRQKAAKSLEKQKGKKANKEAQSTYTTEQKYPLKTPT